MITHIIPSMRLALSHVTLKNGLITSGEVVNGNWLLKRNRNGTMWNVMNISGDGKPVNRIPITPADDVFVSVPKKVSNDYALAFDWLEKKKEKGLVE